MSDKKDGESFQYQLKISYVKMKMKFPCRMALEYNKQHLTKQSPSNQQYKFVFNQLVVLRGEGDGSSFQILASLYTQKGTKYTSGSMKLLTSQLKRSKGERLVIPLTKCLDPEAFCELVVQGVVDLKQSQIKLSRSSSKVLNSPEKPDIVSPLPKKINSEKFLGGQTRSQVHFNPAFNLGSQDRLRDVGAKSQVFKTFTKSPTSKYSNIKYATYNGNLLGANMKSQFPIEEGAASQRTSFDQGQVYREGYLKLKQKFKKQTELLKQQTRKRVALESNQNNLKLQIMKMRVKSQEQEKIISDKNEKIKIFSTQLSQFQKKDLDLAYVKEQCASLQRKTKIQEETIASLAFDYESIKKMMSDKSKLDETTIIGLRQEIQLAKNKVDELKYEYELQNRAKENIISTKNNDIVSRNATIERQKQLIKDFEQQAEVKLFDYERSLNAERASFQLKIDELKLKISNIENQRYGQEQKNALLQSEVQRLNASITTLQFNKKIISQELALSNQESAQLKLIRDKFNELTKQHRFLEEQFSTVRKNLQATLQNKQVNLTELLQQYESGKERSEKLKSEQDQKIKSLLVKISEYELNADVNKNALEKSKRINEGILKENNSLREQNKQIRQDLKNSEKKLINFESDYSSFSTKNQREILGLKILIQKLKQEREKNEKQMEQLRDKNDNFSDSLKEYQQKESKWKLKQRHYEQKIQKQSAKNKQTTSKLESIIKSQENIIADNQNSLESINNQNRNLRKKINQLQLSAIKQRQSTQRLKKDIKLAEQKILGLQQQIKNKNEELKSYEEKTNYLEINISEKDHQISKMKEKQLQQSINIKKQQQIIAMVNKELQKSKKINEELVSSVKNKESSEQKLRQALKIEKQGNVKQKCKTTKVESDFQKFKEGINDIIKIQFTRILNTPTTTQKNTQRLRQSQVSNAKSERSHRSKVPLDVGILTSALMQKIHDTKNNLWKMAQLNKFLKQQNNRLLTHSENQSNKYQFAQLELHRDIQLLEDEMNNIMNDKEVECQNYDQLVLDLNFKLKQKESEVEDLKTQIAEYEAIVSGLKTQFQVNNELNEKKISSFKQSAEELNNRIEYLNLNVACLEDKSHELQQKTIEQEAQIISYKQMLIKNEKIALDLKESEQKLTINLQTLKKQFKSKHESYLELQMQLNSEKESRQKCISMLEEEQKKCQKLNEFVNSLILQKQNAIKSQLQKSQQNNQLQNKIFEVSHQKQLLNEQNQNLKKKVDEFKNENKSLNKNIKNIQKQLAQQKAKNTKNMQKIKQRQSDLQIKRQYIKDLQQKYRIICDKNYKEIRQLSDQLQDKNVISINASKQFNQTLIKIQTENKKQSEEISMLKLQIQSLNAQLQAQKDKTEEQSIHINQIKQQKQAFEEELTSREFALRERAEELTKLEQLVGQLRLQIHNLQAQCESQEKNFTRHVQQLNNDFNFQVEETARQNTHQYEILIEQNKQLKSKSENLQELLAKTINQHRTTNTQYELKIASFQQKLKKIESQRLITIQAKNNQIKKISQQSKIHHQRVRQKQAEIRKINLQLEQNKSFQAQLQAKISHLTEQGKNKQKVLQKEIQNLRQREKISQENKQKMLAQLHENEVQIRKLISQAIKKSIEGCCKADSEKVYTAMKGLEANVTQAMMTKIIKE